jgi:3',5'-cyclic AMP phosphodiesterase CpdA
LADVLQCQHEASAVSSNLHILRGESVPIWDLRDGDADDNRTSPHGGGMRSVVLSAALEFNYLNAFLSFLTLIIGPALLVGITPSLVFTFGHLKWNTVASAGYNPIVAVIILIALLGFALWIGRPILSKAVEKFWHLHYTLVFPAFVILREILRSAVEHLPGQQNTREQMDRRRRLGTILGALLIAGGGLFVALLFGLQVIDVERVRPWAVARAVLGNAAFVLGLSTAAESLYWVWRELTLRGRVLDWTPNSSMPATSCSRVAHLSDLHFVGERYGYRMESGTHGPQGNGCLRIALRKLAAIHASTPLQRILVTGDITDAGTRAEWAEFLDLFEDFPELRACLSFVPGNHDVNIVDRNNPGRLDLPWSAGQCLRQFRTVVAMDMIQGDRAHVVDRATGALGPSLSDYLRQGDREDRLRTLAGTGAVRGRREMARVWEEIFPLVEPPAAGAGYGVIHLNSNARSHFALTNAIGVVNPSQLKALKSILRGSARTSWIILLHHQVVEYPAPSIPLTDRIGLALVNAPDVLDAIAPYAARCLVLHGHRHRDWIGTCGDVVLCSAPSVTMGSQGENEFHGSFYIHELAVGKGGVRLNTTERINVS